MNRVYLLIYYINIKNLQTNTFRKDTEYFLEMQMNKITIISALILTNVIIYVLLSINDKITLNRYFIVDN